MPLTFGEVRKLVAPYTGAAGKCADDPEVAIAARQVMTNLLYSGSTSAIRKLCIIAFEGCVALPPEVEVPLKVRIDHQVSNVWNKWFSFHSSGQKFEGTPTSPCFTASEVLVEDGSETPLAYDIPSGGSLIGIRATCDEDPEARITIAGKDPTGREIYTTFRGDKVVGEQFTFNKNTILYGKVIYGQVLGVIKPKTNGYITAWAVDPVTKNQKFLADWSPSETTPMYKKYKILSRQCAAASHISLLCRVKLKDTYADNELTFFDNELAVTLSAQRIQGELNNNLEVANYKRQAVENVLEQEAGYKKISGMPVDVYYPMSAGRIRNIR